MIYKIVKAVSDSIDIPCTVKIRAGVDSASKNAVECALAAEAGGEVCIIHPDNYKSAEENAEMYHELLPFAKQHGVKIATENMWNWDKEQGIALPAACSSVQSFTEHIKTVNDSDFIACLDIGHAEMMGESVSAEQMIFALRDKLGALHIHDNRCVTDTDDHLLPFVGNIDFEEVAKAIAKSGYKGTVMLELNRFALVEGKKIYEDLDDEEYIKRAVDSARKLADMIERNFTLNI